MIDSRFVNRNWKIKASGHARKGYVHKYVGVAGLLRLVGMELATKMVEKSRTKGKDKVVFRLRSGLRIIFISK